MKHTEAGNGSDIKRFDSVNNNCDCFPTLNHFFNKVINLPTSVYCSGDGISALSNICLQP